MSLMPNILGFHLEVGHQKRLNRARTRDGQTLTETEDILERWREYCETLYTDTDNEEYVMELQSSEPVPTREEVKKALDSTKSGKAAGPDGIPIELLKLGEDSVVSLMLCIESSGPYGMMANGPKTGHNQPLCLCSRKEIPRYARTIVQYH